MEYWVKVDHGRFNKARRWYREIRHKIIMANAEHGYIKGEMYVPPHVADAIDMWYDSPYLNSAMTLDRYLIKMFDTKKLK